MQKVSRFLLIISIFSICLIFSGCKNSYENMIEEFDGKYFMPEPKVYIPYSINSPDFNPKDMLAPSYVFPEDVYINLEAPENCTTYLWKIVDSKGNELSNPNEPESERVFYHAASDGFRVGEENILILTVTVTDSQGNITEYIDESVIIIKAQSDLDLEE